MKQYKFQLLLGVLALLAGVASAQSVSFGLIGDMPYSRWERQQMPELLADMDREGLAFIVHDGDIKGGGSVCSDAVLHDILKVFQASKTPLVYVPGDNEWTDCHRASNGGYDPLERLHKLRKLFFAGDRALGQRVLALERQSRDPGFASYRENVRWEAGGALFVGLNLPGSENNFQGSSQGGGPSAEFVARSAANQVWLAQAFERARTRKLAGLLIVIQANPGFEAANQGRALPGYAAFLTQLREATQAFAGQVVLVHGDSHWQRIDQPLRDPVTQAVIGNFTRVETYGYPFFGWVKASVDATDPQVFRFSPRVWRGDRTD